MRFWKLLASIFQSNRPSDRKQRRPRHMRIGERLDGTDRLEDRSALRMLRPDLDLSGRPPVAEVVHVPGHREQTVQLQRRFLRLSVVVVDYLLEHEWLSLLGGHRRRATGKSGRRAARGAGQLVPASDLADPVDEPNRTACVNESPWSIVTAIEQTPDSGSTNSTDE